MQKRLWRAILNPMKEKELKIRVDSHAKILDRLAELGAEFLYWVEQTDSFYDTRDGKFLMGDCCLRLRRVVHMDGLKDDEYLLAWKGPREDTHAKIRTEYETSVSSPQAVEGIIKSLGYEKTFEVVKKRRSYRLGGCKVELDELPMLGLFVEIEGDDVKELEKTQRLLNIQAAHESRSYASMLNEAMKHTEKN